MLSAHKQKLHAKQIISTYNLALLVMALAFSGAGCSANPLGAFGEGELHGSFKRTGMSGQGSVEAGGGAGLGVAFGAVRDGDHPPLKKTMALALPPTLVGPQILGEISKPELTTPDGQITPADEKRGRA